MCVLIRAFVGLALILSAGVARAGEVEIVDAKARVSSTGTYSFDVTLKHGDTGWEHYADAWDVVAPDGTVLGKRTLHHPHVEEQPFTRSLSGIAIPDDIKVVTIRAYDKVHGRSKATVDVKLADRE